jgi:predicted alternative tryptophan synthase beta-subunit
VGSHKPNTAVPQAFYNREAGLARLSTEPGAGQWGPALAYAGSLFGLEVEVYMVKVSFEQKPYRFNLCGHGHFDMQAYIDYFDGKLSDQEYDASELAMALAGLPSVG